MDVPRFDALAVRLARSRSRRGALRFFGGIAAAGLLAARVPDALADPGQVKLTCGHDGDPCNVVAPNCCGQAVCAPDAIGSAAGTCQKVSKRKTG